MINKNINKLKLIVIVTINFLDIYITLNLKIVYKTKYISEY